MALERLTIMVTDSAARLSALTSLVLVLVYAPPYWISHIRCVRARFSLKMELEGLSSEMGFAKRLTISDT